MSGCRERYLRAVQVKRATVLIEVCIIQSESRKETPLRGIDTKRIDLPISIREGTRVVIDDLRKRKISKGTSLGEN